MAELEVVMLTERSLATVDAKAPARLWHERLLSLGLLRVPDAPLLRDPDGPGLLLAALQLALADLEEAEDELRQARTSDPFRTGTPRPAVFIVPLVFFGLLAPFSGVWTALVATLMVSAAVAIAGLVRLWTIEDRARKARLSAAEVDIIDKRTALHTARQSLYAESFVLRLGRRLVFRVPAREHIVMERDRCLPGTAERMAHAARLSALDERIAAHRASPPETWSDEGLLPPENP
jgi:hypothetical protein